MLFESGGKGGELFLMGMEGEFVVDGCVLVDDCVESVECEIFDG